MLPPISATLQRLPLRHRRHLPQCWRSSHQPRQRRQIWTLPERSYRVGLVKLFELLNPETTVADLICVDGLNGSSHSTWLHKESDVHWPSNFLCRDIDNARIFTIGYDATVFRFVHSVSRHHIQDHAANLLHHLTIERESTGTVPPNTLD